MNRKLIIIAAAAGLLSFAGAFVFSWLSKKGQHSQSPEAGQSTRVSPGFSAKLQQSEAGIAPARDAGVKAAMTEKQLKSLVYDVQEKIQEYNGKLRSLEAWEQQLETAQAALTKDVEKLHTLQIELSATVATIKSEREKLDKSTVKIGNLEKKNLMSIAATYDKMDAGAASAILTNMGQAQKGRADDAVKILYYMAERSKAKLLAELTTSNPKLAAQFCQKLTEITETE